MSSPCPNCGSWSVRHDRSLGGRAVCGACGAVLGVRRGRARRQQRSTAPRPWFWLFLGMAVLIAVGLAHEKGLWRLPTRFLSPPTQPSALFWFRCVTMATAVRPLP